MLLTFMLHSELDALEWKKHLAWINSELKKGIRDRDAAEKKSYGIEWSTRLGKVQKVAKYNKQ